MFIPKTDKVEKISKSFEKSIEQMEKLLVGKVIVYIDDANVRPWSNRLNWHIDYKRLKQFLESFDNINSVKIYRGTLRGDVVSEESVAELRKLKYDVRTKDVKIMKHSIDVTSVSSMASPDLLEKFIRKCLLREFKLEVIEYLNENFKQMNLAGKLFVKDLKCNFDVEIGVDMLLDNERSEAETFILWSGDSDFADPIETLLNNGKRVILFSTVGRVSTELGRLREKGLFIFDIKKIRNFICWGREIEQKIKSGI